MASSISRRDNFIRRVHEALLTTVGPATKLLSPRIGDDVCAGVVCPGKGIYLTRATILDMTETTRRVFCFDLGSVTFIPRSRVWVLSQAAASIPRATFSESIRNGSPFRRVEIRSRTPAAVESLIVQSINEDGSCGVTSSKIDPTVHDTLLEELQHAAESAPFVPKQLEVGDFVLALSRPTEGSEVWCRSLVLCLPDRGMTRVEHVDYGCFERVAVRDIRTLPPYLAIEPALALVLRTDLAGVKVELNCEYRFAIGDPVDDYGRMYLLADGGNQMESPGSTDDCRSCSGEIVQGVDARARVGRRDDDRQMMDNRPQHPTRSDSSSAEFLIAEQQYGTWTRALVIGVLPNGSRGEQYATLRLLPETGSPEEDDRLPTDSFNVFVASGCLSNDVRVVFVKALTRAFSNHGIGILPVAVRT